MSILIKGLDMPKNGDYTFHFASDENGENTIVLIRNNLTGTIVVNEGVIEIPTPHGRLIDADKVFCYDFMDEQNIDNAPTIIEAEGSEEMEEWNSYSHGKIYAPKGTFQKILEAEE